MSTPKADWSRLSDKDLYSSFTEIKWRSLSRDEKLQAVQEVENRQAALYGRPAIPVSIDPSLSERTYGGYSHMLKQIHLNEEFFKTHVFPSAQFPPAMLLNTILHEGRHAYQHHLVDHSDIEAHSCDLLKVWKFNCNEGYISPRMNRWLYFQQAIERDARMFALKELKRISTMIPADRQLIAVLESAKQAEYDRILEAYQLFPTLEDLDRWEQQFLQNLSSKGLLTEGIDQRTFHFLAETRMILELSYTAGLNIEEIFGHLEKYYMDSDFDLMARFYDSLIQKHPEQFEELMKHKLQAMERNQKWKELLVSQTEIASMEKALEHQDIKASYRIQT